MPENLFRHILKRDVKPASSDNPGYSDTTYPAGDKFPVTDCKYDVNYQRRVAHWSNAATAIVVIGALGGALHGVLGNPGRERVHVNDTATVASVLQPAATLIAEDAIALHKARPEVIHETVISKDEVPRGTLPLVEISGTVKDPTFKGTRTIDVVLPEINGVLQPKGVVYVSVSYIDTSEGPEIDHQITLKGPDGNIFARKDKTLAQSGGGEGNKGWVGSDVFKYPGLEEPDDISNTSNRKFYFRYGDSPKPDVNTASIIAYDVPFALRDIDNAHGVSFKPVT